MAEIDWTTYTSRLTINGSDEKEIIINELKNNITNNIINSPSCLTVEINGTSSNLIILSSDRGKENERKIKSLPDENYNLGDLVEYDGFNWLVTEYSRDNINQAIGRMAQCNYTLKFQNASGQIISLPVIFETKTNTVDEGKMLDVVDGVGSIKVQFYKEYSDILTTNKRLIIDNRTSASIPNVYKIVDSTLNSYDGGTTGLLSLSLTRDEFNASTDSLIYWVADYETKTMSTGTAQILYTGNCEIKSGGSIKSFTAVFKDSQGHTLSLTPTWSITKPVGYTSYVTATDVNGVYKVQALDNENLIGLNVVIGVTSGEYVGSLTVPIVSLI